jgi:arsenite methyltransferase
MTHLQQDQTRPHAETTPFSIEMPHALRLIDTHFGIDRILRDTGRDILKPYYAQSKHGYLRLNSHRGCMHISLNPDGHFDPDGHFTQIREVSDQIRQIGARNILELGSGMGFNALSLADMHQDVRITGLDLLPQHVKTARKAARARSNVSFTQASYEDVPDSLYGVDLVFAIETLCYASDPDRAARHIAAALVPGGRFVMYDGFRRPDFDAAPEDVITASRLFEVSMAVTSGFWRCADWEAALERAGLRVLRSQDLTRDSIACMRKYQARAVKLLTTPKYAALRYLMPKYLLGNAIAGLTGPFAIEGKTPNTGRSEASITYNLILAEKPA